jgi:hypothetical protein
MDAATSAELYLAECVKVQRFAEKYMLEHFGATELGRELTPREVGEMCLAYVESKEKGETQNGNH